MEGVGWGLMRGLSGLSLIELSHPDASCVCTCLANTYSIVLYLFTLSRLQQRTHSARPIYLNKTQGLRLSHGLNTG